MSFLLKTGLALHSVESNCAFLGTTTSIPDVYVAMDPVTGIDFMNGSQVDREKNFVSQFQYYLLKNQRSAMKKFSSIKRKTCKNQERILANRRRLALTGPDVQYFFDEDGIPVKGMKVMR